MYVVIGSACINIYIQSVATLLGAHLLFNADRNVSEYMKTCTRGGMMSTAEPGQGFEFLTNC